MKIISKLEVHPATYFFALVCMVTGRFQAFIMLSSLFLIHELGHVLAGLYFHWNIQKIVFLPFGGMTVFQEQLNRPIKEESWIVVMGPLFQILAYYSLRSFFPPIFLFYHLFFLGFNLLPILPLDGSKMVKLLLERFFSYSSSHKKSILLSFFLLSVFFFYTIFLRNLLLAFVFFFLFVGTYREMKQHVFLCERFLLERYMNSFSFPKDCQIKGDNLFKMKRDYHHLFYKEGAYWTERELLKKKFENTVYK